MSEPKTIPNTPSPQAQSHSSDRNHEHDDSLGDGAEHPRKRQRVRLSCLECRRRKLSCDRGFPCDRCIRSGTQERCTYETRPGLAPPAKNGLSQGALTTLESRLSISSPHPDFISTRKEQPSLPREGDRLRRLELEVAQLKHLLSKQLSSDASTTLHGGSPTTDKDDARDTQDTLVGTNTTLPPGFAGTNTADLDELRFFRGREFKNKYYGPNNAAMAFIELSGLCPFMKETAAEWLRPPPSDKSQKDRGKRRRDREARFTQPDKDLEALLPSREETDILVRVYMDQFEQIYRIVHYFSFYREYNKYWEPGAERTAAFTALLLSMLAVAACIRGNPTGRFVGRISYSQHQAQEWIQACEVWNDRQSHKHRKLIHYQIMAMNYLAKRVNVVKKKRFWTSSCALIQEGICVGLHRDPSFIQENLSPYNQEMRRRIWATLQELDMQAAFDQGLPTMLSSLRSDVASPANLDDKDFDEDSTELPESRPLSTYTFGSYQRVSRQSLPLRLRLSRVLTGPEEDLDYEQVIHYTNEITQAIDALPSWDLKNDPAAEAKKPLLAYTLLHIQLRQYIIPLHQPYLKLRQTNSKYQYSEIIYYNAARDMVLLHDKLSELGVRALNQLRGDALMLSINLCCVTLMQPRGSTNMIMVNAQHTLKLLEKCLLIKENSILRCGNNEPWGYSIMCAAMGLLEAHLGEKTPEAAKASSAERFINMHYKLLAWEHPNEAAAAATANGEPGQPASQQLLAPPPPVPGGKGLGVEVNGLERPKSVTPFFSASQVSNMGLGLSDPLPTPWWISNADSSLQPQPINPDFSLELLGMNINELWADYEWDNFSGIGA